MHTDLAKPPIKGLSLKKELERVISDWTNRATPHYAEPIKVYLSCSEEIRLPELIQNTIARITSGAVANSILHSKIITDPKISINIKVHKNENTIILIVSDNGNGKKHIREGYGITRMRQLTDLLVKKYKVTYANFSIVSDPNNGTSVSVEISIPENLSLLA